MNAAGGNDQTHVIRHDQISENLRFHVDMRFKQLTLFVAFLSFSGAGFISESSQTEFIPNVTLKQLISSFCVLFTTVLLIMEVRSHLYWRKHHEIDKNLWPSPTVNFSFINSTNAVLFLYLSTLIFSCYVTAILFKSTLVIFLVSTLALFFSGYSIYCYWSTRRPISSTEQAS